MSKRTKKLLPYYLTVFLGTLILVLCFGAWGLSYILITISGLFWLWARICTHCYGYGSKACPSGYGLISARFFKRSQKRDFNRAFKTNIWVIALQWFIPLFVGIYCMIRSFNPIHTGILFVFVLLGFVYLPISSKKNECKKCPQVTCPMKE